MVVSWLFSTNAKDIGTQYLILAIFTGLLGIAFSVLIWMELSGAGNQILNRDHQLYNVIATTHGIFMIYFMVVNYPKYAMFVVLGRVSWGGIKYGMYHNRFTSENMMSIVINWIRLGRLTAFLTICMLLVVHCGPRRKGRDLWLSMRLLCVLHTDSHTWSLGKPVNSRLMRSIKGWRVGSSFTMAPTALATAVILCAKKVLLTWIMTSTSVWLSGKPIWRKNQIPPTINNRQNNI